MMAAMAALAVRLVVRAVQVALGLLLVAAGVAVGLVLRLTELAETVRQDKSS